MLTAPRISVKTQLTFTILLVILISWIVSTGLTNYYMYLSIKSMRNEMILQGNNFAYFIPEPKFGVSDFFFGTGLFGPRMPRTQSPGPDMPRDNLKQGPGFPGPQFGGNNNGQKMDAPPNGRQFGPPPPPKQSSVITNIMMVRIGVALILALLAGSWLGRRFSRPLTGLAVGAKNFHSGNFEYRIPVSGENEFSQVAHSMNEMAKRVSQQIGDLEEDAKRRRQFLADVAHELRSPVTTMKTMAGALNDGLAEDPERKQKAVSALVRTSERLLRLVVDLMDLAKLDLKELPLNLRLVDLRDVLNNVIQSYEDQALNAGISILPLQSGPPVMAKVDPDRIAQVAGNLFENAISYAGEGSQIKVFIEDGDNVRLSISDNGRGIPSKDMQYIFDPFYRVDTVRTPGESHSGLGLRIVRGIVEAHGGKLTLSSIERQGTSIDILLPK
ncbi:MAG: ATP-binding protein [Armatimonadota bacterium]